MLAGPDPLRSKLSIYRLRLHAGRVRELGYYKQFDSLMRRVDKETELDMLRNHYRFVQEERRR
eukprot:2923787-Prymnesium_polylepis.1